jgi:hypothetical protein
MFTLLVSASSQWHHKFGHDHRPRILISKIRGQPLETCLKDINGSKPFHLPRIMTQTGLKADVTYLTLSGYVSHYIPK